MPRARSRRSSSAVWISASICVSISAALAGSRAVRSRASRVFTDSATSCCCAPSWMLRSSRRRSWSCAVTSRRCEARSSSTRRTFRRTRPACDARSRTRRSFDGFIGSLGGIATESAPRSSPRSRTSTTVSPSIVGRASFATTGDVPRARRPSATRPPAAARADAEPHPRRAGARGLAEDLRHPAEDVLGRVRLPDAFGELGQHLVRGRPPAVDDAIGDPAREPRHRPEREPEQQRDDEHGAGALVAGGDHAQEPDDGRVGRDHEQDERARDERLLHDDVEVVQVVLQDGDRHGDRATR